MLRNEKPPIIPKLTHLLDTSNFRSIHDDMSVKIAQDRGIRDFDLRDDDPFRDFESVSLAQQTADEETDAEFSALVEKAIHSAGPALAATKSPPPPAAAT